MNQFQPSTVPISESSVPKSKVPQIVNKIPILQPITFSLFDDLDDFKENDNKIIEPEQSDDPKIIETKLSEAKISETNKSSSKLFTVKAKQRAPTNRDLVGAILNNSEEYLPPTPERKKD